MIILIAFNKDGRRQGYVRRMAASKREGYKWHYTWFLDKAMAFDTFEQAHAFKPALRDGDFVRCAERYSPTEARALREAA